LAITGGTVKVLKTGRPITIEFTLGGFTGNANLYYAVAAQDAEAPALSAYQKAFPDGVTAGVQILDVTAAVAALGGSWRDGYDVYLALMQEGKAARESVRLPRVVDMNVGG
jgi:hypothetical protein